MPEYSPQSNRDRALEALRIGATRVLDMHLEDLQVLVIGHVDREDVDGMLWDPMPGGSGLIDQIRDAFDEVVAAALDVVQGCPAACEHSCIDCLQSFRNSHYHKHLDRHVASESLQEWGDTLVLQHQIPARHPQPHGHVLDAQPVNDAETKLKHLLDAAGFTAGQFQHHIRFRRPISVGHPLGSTTPDVYFAGDEDDEDDRGVCIYLDGLSSSIHGDHQTAERDREIRTWLRNNGYQVIEIPCSDLDDRGAMIRHFKRLARYLEGRSLAERIVSDTTWFDEASNSADGKNGGS